MQWLGYRSVPWPKHAFATRCFNFLYFVGERVIAFRTSSAVGFDRGRQPISQRCLNHFPVFYIPPSLLFVLLFQSALVNLIAVIELNGTVSKSPDLNPNNPDVSTSRRIIVDYVDIFLSLL